MMKLDNDVLPTAGGPVSQYICELSSLASSVQSRKEGFRRIH
jgi:hypothetical protein